MEGRGLGARASITEPSLHLVSHFRCIHTGIVLANVVSTSEELDLVELVKSGLVREGDILVYKRHFPSLSTTVEKDMLVRFLLYAFGSASA